ncbi:MAG: YjbH domain-containing protein [Cocleimonas sp.]
MNKIIFISVSSLFFITPLIADDLAFPGFTGVLRTPTAEIAPKGGFNYQFNNYSDLGTIEDKTYNHVFVVGIGSNFELGGRLTDWYQDDRLEVSSGYSRSGSDGQLAGKRDLSGNFKFKFPLLHPALPELAVGMTDFAGLAVNFKTAYGVATKQLGKFQFSVGYAKSAAPRNKTHKRVLVGSFLNTKVDLTSDLSLMADYVSKDISAGFRYKVNAFDKLSLSVQALVHRENNKWDKTLGLSLSVPLSFGKNKLIKNSKIFTLKSESRNTHKFLVKMRELGFSNVKLGKKDQTDVVVFENHLFNHSYIDPFAVVFANAYRYLGGSAKLTAVMLKQQVPIFAVKINMNDYESFIRNKHAGHSKLKSTSKAWFVKSNDLNGVNWYASSIIKNKSPINIEFRPELNTTVGTEFGIFDYSLGVTTKLDIPITKGVNIVATTTLPLSNSNNYDDGKIFGLRRLGSKVNQLAIQKFMKPTAELSLISGVGYGSIDNDGFMVGEGVVLWQPGEGNNQVAARVTHMKASNNNVEDETMALVSYKRNWDDEYNTSAAITYGQHYNKDKGVAAAVSRYFGDTELAVYVKGVGVDDLSGGLAISLPLTPRRDNKFGNMVVKGTPSFNYGLETTIKDPLDPTHNTLRYDMLLAPGLENNLSGFYDRLRMTPAHFLNNLYHLKEATISLAK